MPILFEDAHCLAVAKPPGQLTQGTWAPPGEQTLETAIRAYLAPAEPQAVYLGMVHRLDRVTSGVLLWAKTPKAARRLSTQFEQRRVVKEYWAIVERHDPTTDPGRPQPISPEIWVDWITRADSSGVVSIVAPHTPGARVAITRVAPAQATALPAGWQWLRLWPQTGRTHQLRAQATRRGHPIVGDTTYGAAPSTIFAAGIALHARLLVVRHPSSNIELKLVAPLPDFWQSAGIDLGQVPDQIDA